jgi:oxygen-independent coproporphyrinogen-3 oxidase
VYGFGVSAHSFDGRERYANVRDTNVYVEQIENTGSAETMREQIDLASEYAFLGLRMEQGIDLLDYKHRTGVDLAERYGGELTRLTDLGLIDLTAERLRLTQRGKLFSNEVFEVFV